MRQIRIICVVLLCFIAGLYSSPNSTAADAIRILFVGNSLTFANDLPGMIAAMALAEGQEIEYQVSAPGGWRLARHDRDPRLDQLLKERKWDYVVLQEQSQLPAFDQRRLKKDIYPYVENLVKKIRRANRSTKVLFYMTMAHQRGDRNAQNRKLYPDVATYEGMQKRINQTYVKLSKKHRGMVVPVGEAWRQVRADKPDMNMYADSVHPNAVGSYLGACVFYSSIFNRLAPKHIHPAQVQPSQADYLRQVAHQTVKRWGRWDWD